MPDKIDETIQDGEIVEESSGTVDTADEVNAATSSFLQLEGLVKQYLATIEKLKEELKEKSQMLNDGFEGDAVYQEHLAKAKEANRIKNATRQQLLKQPAMQELDEKVKDLKFDIKDNQTILSDYLTQYQKASGATQIETEDGEVMEIVSVVKLVKVTRSSS